MFNINIMDMVSQLEQDTKATHCGQFWTWLPQIHKNNDAKYNTSNLYAVINLIFKNSVELLQKDNLDWTDDINDYIDNFLYLSAQKKYNTPVKELMAQFEDMSEKLLNEINSSGISSNEIKSYNYAWPPLSTLDNFVYEYFMGIFQNYTEEQLIRSMRDDLKMWIYAFNKYYVPLFQRIETFLTEVQKQLINEIEKVKVKQGITKENIAQVQNYVNLIKNQIMGAA